MSSQQAAEGMGLSGWSQLRTKALKPAKGAEVKAKPSTEELSEVTPLPEVCTNPQSDADTAKRQEGCGCSSSAISIKPT